MLFRYVVSAIIVLLAKAFTLIAAPIVSIFWSKRLPRPLYWMQTFDADLAEYWSGNYAKWLYPYFSQEYYDSHKWFRWFCRVCWLWRNPAYGTALWLGYDQTGVDVIEDNDPDDSIWNSELPCTVVRRFTNGKNQKGFMFKHRSKSFLGLYIQSGFGWKVPWEDETKAMIMVRPITLRKAGNERTSG